MSNDELTGKNYDHRKTLVEKELKRLAAGLSCLTLSVDTAAVGPAEHRILVKYLDVHVAQREFSSLKAAVA